MIVAVNIEMHYHQYHIHYFDLVTHNLIDIQLGVAEDNSSDIVNIVLGMVSLYLNIATVAFEAYMVALMLHMVTVDIADVAVALLVAFY